MSKLTILALLIIVAALIFSGVIEIKVFPSRIVEAPKRIKETVFDKSFIARSRVLGVNLKRTGEQLLVRDEEKKIDLVLLYVQLDAERLSKLVDEQADINQLTIEGTLLAKSLERVRDVTKTAPEDTLDAIKDEATKTMTSAQEALALLSKQAEQLKESQEQFSNLIKAIDEQISRLGEAEYFDTGTVKSATDKADQTPAKTPAASPNSDTEEVPLSF